jgi:hypothetical protein
MPELPRAFVTVYQPISGWKAVLVVRDEECDGEHTPWQTGYFAYPTKEEAIVDAKQWAEAEEIPFIE